MFIRLWRKLVETMSAKNPTSRPAVLTVMNLPPFYLEPLRRHFTLYERLHETDPEAFAKVAPTIRGVTGGGESQVSRALMARLPALEIVSIMGVGYDKVD